MRSIARHLLLLAAVAQGCGEASRPKASDTPLNDGGFAGHTDDGGADAGNTADDGGAPAELTLPDYGNPTLLPDSDTTKVAQCVGQPDLTLCDIVTTPDRWYDVCVNGVCVSPGCGDASCNTSGPHFIIPPAQEHPYLDKLAGDEPVTVDLVTGLHFQTCVAGLSGADCKHGTALELTLPEALVYCDELSWAGHDDWYLPDMHELMSVVDFAPKNPGGGVLDSAAFPHPDNVQGRLWTTTFFDGSELLFDTGATSIGFGIVAEAWYEDAVPVRCVRRGFSRPMASTTRWTHKSFAHPVFEDHTTQLMWQGCSSGPGSINCDPPNEVTAAQLEAHCQNLVWAEFSDWRAATFKEAHSLMNYTLDDRALDPALGHVSGVFLLTSNSLLDLYDTSLTGIGISDATYPTRCVRGPLW